MANDLYPDPVGSDRKKIAKKIRSRAADARPNIPHPAHTGNGEIDHYHPQVPTNFSKGLKHNEYGIVDEKAFKPFVNFINQKRKSGGFGYSDPNGDDVTAGAAYNDKNANSRTWESPLAGHVYSLEGPDSDAVTMPPAPKLSSGELAVEMAEVYGLALLRDVPFSDITAGKGDAKKVIDGLAGFSWFKTKQKDKHTEARRKARLDLTDKSLTAHVAFRGSTEGARKGPYLSQFMLIGNASRDDGGKEGHAPIYTTGSAAGAHLTCPINGPDGEPSNANDGLIVYGAQQINQRVHAHKPGVDYMTNWADWIDVQNGADFKNRDKFLDQRRFITTPRDLATYVHFDQLYQAYLNACILMLGYQFPFDRGLPEGGGHPVRDAFATFGGPHILSLLTEVASRALKFARRQKFNIHLRARPEAIAGILTLAASDNHADELGQKAKKDAKAMIAAFEKAGQHGGCNILDLIQKKNAHTTPDPGGWIEAKHNYLLPMAFPEGSPMHPSYAAGHATVAGACVTIIKAFFEMFENDKDWTETPFTRLYGNDPDQVIKGGFTSGFFEPEADGQSLRQLAPSAELESVTVQGELDKLAANIAIGRDMAGVHYYTDYYESLRVGERMAVGILQEQMLTYPEKVSMRLKTFDGECMTICGHGNGQTVDVDIAGGYEAWFSRGTSDSMLIAGKGSKKKVA